MVRSRPIGQRARPQCGALHAIWIDGPQRIVQRHVEGYRYKDAAGEQRYRMECVPVEQGKDREQDADRGRSEQRCEKPGFRTTTLIDYMAAMPWLGGKRPSARIT